MAHLRTSARASTIVLPISDVIRAAKRSISASSRSESRVSIRARSAIGVRRQLSKPDRACASSVSIPAASSTG